MARPSIRVTAFINPPTVEYRYNGKGFFMDLNDHMCNYYLGEEVEVPDEVFSHMGGNPYAKTAKVWVWPEVTALTEEQLLILIEANHAKHGQPC